MKLVVLKGGDEAVPLQQCVQPGHLPSRAAGAAALSGDGRHWVLLNVSPAVAEQLSTDARLLRHTGLADAPVRVVVLTDAQMDHVTGLLSLRDGAPIHLFATPAVFEALTDALPVLPMLQHYCGVHWHVIPVAGECRTAVFSIDGQPTLEFTAVATDGPAPRHIARAAQPVVGETIALAVRDLVSGQRLFCTNNLAGAGPTAVEWMREADCVLLGDEADAAVPRHGLGSAHGAHVAHGTHGTHGTHGAWAQLEDVRARRKLLMVPADPASARRPAADVLARWGCEVVADRMEIEL